MYTSKDLFFLFRDEEDANEEIKSMPGIYRQGLNHVKSMLDSVVESGLKSIMVFGVINKLPKVMKIKF